MADAGIYQQFLRTPKSAIEYGAELDQADSARNQNALTGLALRQKMQADARAQQTQNALQKIASTWTAETTPDKRIADLRNSGLPELMGQADTLEKGFLDRQKTDAEVGQKKAETTRLQGTTIDDAVKRYRGALDYIDTPQGAARWMQAQYQDPVLGQHMASMGPIETALQRIPQDPAEFQQWRQRNAQGMDKFIESQQKGAQQAETGRHNLATEAGTIRGQNVTAETARRGQNMTDERAGAALDQGKTPTGYRRTESGDLQAIPGGPADTKLQGQLNADTAALTGSISSFDRLASAANEVLNHPGLKGITGLRGAVPNIPGSEAADAQALLGTLKSQVGFGVLQDMRNNSKTGGALGAVSDAEGKRLEANLAALDKSQSLEQYQANLKKIVDYSEAAKDRVREAYNLKHKQASQPTPQAPKPKIESGTDLGGGFRVK